MLTAFQVFRAKMPFTPTAAAAFSFSPSFTRQGGGKYRERKQTEEFFKTFKLELHCVIFFYN